MMKKRHEPGAFRAHIRKGDTVKVLCGRSAGETGRVTQVLPRIERAIVEGVNLITRHQRARGGQRVTAEQQSGRIQKPSPVHVSNLMVICPNCNRQTRVGHREEQDGATIRVCKREGCREPLDRRK
jgi:large subunit ribosomal protein L24